MKKTIAELQQERSAKIAEVRAIDIQSGDEARTRADALMKEIEGVNRSIDLEQRIAEAERQSATAPVGGGSTDFDRAVQGFSLLRAAAHIAGEAVDAGREREVSQELRTRMGVKPSSPHSILIPNVVFDRQQRAQAEKRALLSGSSGAGLIPTEYHGEELVSFLYSKLVTAKLGARVLSGLVGNFTAPAVATGSTTQWVAEGGAITPADYSIGSKTGTPHHIGTISEVSRNMLQQADNPSVNALFASDMASNIAAGVDRAVLRGGGTNEPHGIIKVLTDASDLSTFATPTWAQGLAMIAETDQANTLDSGQAGWAMSPAVSKKLRSTLVAASTDSRMIMDAPNSLYGYAAVTTSSMQDTSVSPHQEDIIFGSNWADALILQWAATELVYNPYESTVFTKGGALFRAMSTVDVIVRHNKSFRVAKDMSVA